jgi:acid stress-induced BolA-like protein IbaG/YrbA
MAKVAQSKLKQILSRKLKLRDPHFFLRKEGSLIVGSMVDPVFKKMTDLQRQNKIWDILESQFGESARSSFGMILAYTPEEWDLPLEGKTRKLPAKKAG